MKKRFSAQIAVFLIILKKENEKTKILLQKRQNTGYMDNMWDLCASGHVENGETATKAIIREAKEEIGIKILDENLEFTGFYYNYIKRKTYCYVYFKAVKYENTPKICEPEKCSALKWFDIENLPTDMIPDRKISVLNYLNNKYFGEFGW